MHSIFIPKEEPPLVCANCEERKRCVAEGFGDACCDECDHLMLWFNEIRGTTL